MFGHFPLTMTEKNPFNLRLTHETANATN